MHEKRYDIQGLRAWAVLSVIVFHFFPALWPYGYLGVDVFFVLSGFLIALVLDGKSPNFPTFQTFYLKRIKRIFPLAILVSLINILLIWSFLVEAEIVNGFKSAFYSLLFATNRKPQDAQGDYFQALESANDLFTHFWSLSVEIQFYLIAPFIMLTASNLTSTKLGPAGCFSLLTIVAIASFAYSTMLEPEIAFSSTISRLWQFMFGAYAYFLHGYLTHDAYKLPEATANNRKTSLVIPLLLAVAFFGEIFTLGNRETLIRAEVTFFAAFILVRNFQSDLLCHRWLQVLGDASYALYLIHWPVVCLLNQFDVEEWQWKLLAACLCVLASLVCHFYYEQWYLSLSTRDCLVLIGVLYLACGASLRLHRDPSANFDMSSAMADWEAESERNISAKEAAAMNAVFERDNSKKMHFDNCTLRNGTGTNPFGFCTMPKGTGSLKFLIIGNSYAANLGPLVVEHFKNSYREISTRAIPQCEPFFMKKDAYCPNPTKSRAEFDNDVKTEQPDVLYIIMRYLEGMVPIKGPIVDDPVYKMILERIAFFEQFVKKKVLIMDALPLAARLVDLEKNRARQGLKMLSYMPEGQELDNEPMRKRLREVARSCKKCALFDPRGVLLNEAGNFTVVHPKTGLRYYDRARHFTPIGLKQIEPFFVKMAAEFPNILKRKYPENVIEWNNTKS